MREKAVFVRMLKIKIYKGSGNYNYKRTDYKKQESGTHVFLILPGKPGIPWKNNST
jgi:hypothetical protein